MDTAWIAIAFVLGFAVRQVGLPPLVGYLGAGFALHALGVTGGPIIDLVSELGITLLLFTIGLKLRVGTLLRPQVWGVASVHMGLSVALAVGTLALVSMVLLEGVGAQLGIEQAAGGPSFTSLVLVGFALSFSSTVFAVKVLEDRGEMSSSHGRISIGILVMQDIFAVGYLALAEGKVPSLYAFALIALVLARPLLGTMMARCGHGELLVLFGLVMALGGAELFQLMEIKGGVGALILGLTLATHPQATELSKALLGFKDLFLIGFFLSIGLSAAPTPESLLLAGLLLVLLPIKVVGLFVLLLVTRARARTALLVSLALANYSEFGLIVAALAVKSGALPEGWIVALAIALAGSFLLAAPLNVFAHALNARWGSRLRDWERPPSTGEAIPATAGVSVIVCGMGRVGSSAYDEMHRRFGDTVIGVDRAEERVQAQVDAGRRVIHGDVTDPKFWDDLSHGALQLVMLAMPNHEETVLSGSLLRERGFPGVILATAQFPDEVAELKAAGITDAYNLRAEAGVGFAALSSTFYR